MNRRRAAAGGPSARPASRRGSRRRRASRRCGRRPRGCGGRCRAAARRRPTTAPRVTRCMHSWRWWSLSQCVLRSSASSTGASSMWEKAMPKWLRSWPWLAPSRNASTCSLAGGCWSRRTSGLCPPCLDGVQDRQRLAAGPVAQQQRRPQQVLPVLAAVDVHRPGDRRLDLRPLVDQVLVSFRGPGPDRRVRRERAVGVASVVIPAPPGALISRPRCSGRVSVATHRARATSASMAALESCSSASCRFSERTYASFPCRPRAISFRAASRRGMLLDCGRTRAGHGRVPGFPPGPRSCRVSGRRSYCSMIPLQPRTVSLQQGAARRAVLLPNPAAAPPATRRLPPDSAIRSVRRGVGRASPDIIGRSLPLSGVKTPSGYFEISKFQVGR